MARKKSQSKAVAEKTVFAALNILKDAGGEARVSEVIEKIRESVEFTDWEKERYEKTGYIRWESILHFYTIDCMKAGFMRKNKGVWSITDEGEEAIKLGPEKLLEAASRKYKEWSIKNKKADKTEPEVDEDASQNQQALIDQYEQEASEGIRNFIIGLNPYEFQDLVAVLLKAMGYFIPYVATRGKDGGVDVIAYSDPLGTKEPRIKVQIKHRPDASVSVDDIRQLIGLLSKPGDVGLFVTSGKFTSESVRSARESHKHIELIDFTRFTDLWQQYYPKMTDEEKNMLPLQPIYFLGVNE
jgi:restriction system protein